MHNLPTYLICEQLDKYDEFRNHLFRVTDIEYQPGYGYERLEKELEGRIPQDDVIYFGDCAGLPVFLPLDYSEDGLEPIVFLGHPDESID